MTRTEIKCYKLCDKIKDKQRMQPASQPVFVVAERTLNEQNGQENEIDILKGAKTNKILRTRFVETKACSFCVVLCCEIESHIQNSSRDTHTHNPNKNKNKNRTHTQMVQNNTTFPYALRAAWNIVMAHG